MPPKKKGKGKKKKKKSKEQEEAERLLREEEERKAREAEARRLERERQRKVEEERKQCEEQARLRAEELERLRREEEEIQQHLALRETKTQAATEQDFKVEEWEKYVKCSQLPDPTSWSELNTYVNVWKSQLEPSMDATMAQCQEGEELATDIIRQISTAEQREDSERAARLFQFLYLLRDISQQKLDHMTANILQFNDLFVGAKSEVLQSGSTEDVKVGVWINLSQKGVRMKQVQFPDLGMAMDISKQLALANIAVRAQYTSYDHVSRGRPLREMTLGGVFTIELLQMPPRRKEVKGWVLRQQTSLAHTVHRLSYPLGHDGAHGAPVPPGAGQALRMKYTLPATALVSEAPRVAAWDNGAQCWSEESVSEVHFDPDTRQLLFHTSALTALAVVQPKHIDLPYERWTLQPTAPGRALLVLEGRRYEMKMEVGEGWVALAGPAELELRHLHGVRMAPGQLIKELYRCGINLSPSDDDAPYSFLEGQEAPILPKEKILEDKMRHDVCTLASAFGLSGSVWNQSRGPSKAVLRIRECLDFSAEAKDESEWKTLQFMRDPDLGHGVKCSFLQATERSDPEERALFQPDQTHAFVQQCLRGRCSPESVEQAASTPVRFQECVSQLLLYIRPFSFS